MKSSYTFGQKIAFGFAVLVLVMFVVAGIGVYALSGVVSAKDRVIDENAHDLAEAQHLQTTIERRMSAARGYLLTGSDEFLRERSDATDELNTTLAKLKSESESEEASKALGAIERASTEYRDAVDEVVALRKSTAALDSVSTAFEKSAVPKRDALEATVRIYDDLERRALEDAKRSATERATFARSLVGGAAGAGLVAAVLVALFLTRGLSRQIGSAVQHVQSSSAELQSAANQQATGAREQATAMAEITTTISELLATSKQIAESAQRVAQIAKQAAASAKGGEQSVSRSNESISAIRQQVDMIVAHMLDLGKRSQQIGSVLEILNELAEQTNILAINATIEAAGAGELGRRFGVVADEIRRLADRVAASTKEIRGLIDEVRGAVNTAVMATEGGSKSVDAGVRQFADVALSFREIAGHVATTTEAAREIELSTKQQATAVEQVNVAVANVAQASKETEVSSGQTLATASQLKDLSRELVRVIRSDSANS